MNDIMRGVHRTAAPHHGSPEQLLSNCVADYVVDELQRCGNRPELMPIPGFTNVVFPK